MPGNLQDLEGFNLNKHAFCCRLQMIFILDNMRMKKGKFAKGITVELPDHLNVAATSVKINKVIKACGGKKILRQPLF